MGFVPNGNGKLKFIQIFTLVAYTIDIICMSGTIIFVAADIEAYMDLFFILAAVFSIAIAYTSIIFTCDKLFINIELSANELNNRE